MNPRSLSDPPCYDCPNEPEIEVPGIDDCDHLYSLSSRSGDDSVYIRVHQFDDGYFAQLTVDSETGHFVDDIGGIEGPYDLPEFACRELVETARQWFRDNGLAYVYCDETRCIVRADPRNRRNVVSWKR